MIKKDSETIETPAESWRREEKFAGGIGISDFK
jgi:hypothetical protein